MIFPQGWCHCPGSFLKGSAEIILFTNNTNIKRDKVKNSWRFPMPDTVRRAFCGQPIQPLPPNETGTRDLPILQIQTQDTEWFNKLLGIQQLVRESLGSHSGRPASEPPNVPILTTCPSNCPLKKTVLETVRTYGKKRSKRLIQNYVGIKNRGRTKRPSLF